MNGGYVVESDLYDIALRIKSIDPDYFLFRNVVHNRFEVHHKNQRGGTLALIVPYDRLDARTLKLVLKSRSERAPELIEEAERQNQTRKKEDLRRIVRRTAARAEEALADL